MSEQAPERQHYGLTFAVLALAGVSYSLLQSLVAPALPVIQHDLHTSATHATWVFTSFLLSASVATPIAGRLGDMFGKERTLLLVLLVLAGGTLVAALASSIALLVVGRLIQGTGGAIFPLAFGIIRDEFPPRRVASGIGFISALLGVGGGAGIVLAGPIVENFSYHWLFWLPLIPTAIAAIATHLFVPESPLKPGGRVSWLGAGLLSGWLVALLLGTSQGPIWGWSDPRVIGLFLGAVVLAVLWVVAESRAAEPLVDMAMMRLRGVWTTNMAATLLGFGMYGSFITIPQFVEAPAGAGYGFHASVTQAGLFLVPSTAGMLAVSPLAGRIAHSVGSRVALMAGALLTMVCFVLLAAANTHRWEIYLASFFLGAGIGLAFAALANLIVEAVPPEQTGVATGMNTIMRTIGGAIGGQVAASLISAYLEASGVPAERGFTLAFAIAAGALFVSFLSALAVPGKPRGPRITAEPATAGSRS
ncbi:MAG TPA: MFS transporter [Thermoleophilaceae bacterium]|nr:MFS transporter [Thermoleophilaceae bacterium]